jgi:hypothetical protein
MPHCTNGQLTLSRSRPCAAPSTTSNSTEDLRWCPSASMYAFAAAVRSKRVKHHHLNGARPCHCQGRRTIGRAVKVRFCDIIARPGRWEGGKSHGTQVSRRCVQLPKLQLAVQTGARRSRSCSFIRQDRVLSLWRAAERVQGGFHSQILPRGSTAKTTRAVSR